MSRVKSLYGSPLVTTRRYTAFAGLPDVYERKKVEAKSHLGSLMFEFLWSQAADRSVRMDVLADRRVILTETVPVLTLATDFAEEWYESEHVLQLAGGEGGAALAKSVASRGASLAILADWIEDDIRNRVKRVDGHRNAKLLVNPDPVLHMLAVMRAHKPKR